MAWLSKEAENEIKKEVAVSVTTFLNNYTKPETRMLGLITQTDLKKERKRLTRLKKLRKRGK